MFCFKQKPAELATSQFSFNYIHYLSSNGRTCVEEADVELRTLRNWGKGTSAFVKPDVLNT